MAARIRLLHVLEATVGGTRRHLLDLCGALPTERFEQHLAYSVLRDPAFGADAAELGALGITLSELPMRREIHPLADWRCLRDLSALIRSWQPQIVHGHSAKGGFLARLAAHRCGLRPAPKVVYNPHGFPFQMRNGAARYLLYLALERHAARFTDALVAPCQSQADLALRHRLLPAERVHVIPNGLDLDRFVPAKPRAELRAALCADLNLPPEARLVTSVAALSPQKGLEYLIRAAAAVCRERLDVRFLLLGEGMLRPALEGLAASLGVADQVHFAGWRNDVADVLAASDLFVLPSLWEGLPYVLLEAGASGVPVVATAIAGNVDLIRTGETGLLVKPADAPDLALQILRALSDPRLPACARALQALVRRDYTLANMLAGHVALYETLVSSP